MWMKTNCPDRLPTRVQQRLCRLRDRRRRLAGLVDGLRDGATPERIAEVNRTARQLCEGLARLLVPIDDGEDSADPPLNSHNAQLNRFKLSLPRKRIVVQVRRWRIGIFWGVQRMPQRLARQRSRLEDCYFRWPWWNIGGLGQRVRSSQPCARRAIAALPFGIGIANLEMAVTGRAETPLPRTAFPPLAMDTRELVKTGM
jgi:hypothetical protein